MFSEDSGPEIEIQENDLTWCIFVNIDVIYDNLRNKKNQFISISYNCGRLRLRQRPISRITFCERRYEAALVQ